MISVIKFAALSLRLNQVVWTLLDMARLSYPLKRIIRRNLLAEVNGGELHNILASDAFDKYRSLFASNHFNDESIWTFNGQKITVDNSFLLEPINKADYTYRMVYFHFEWMFQDQSPDLALFDKMHHSLEQSSMFYHPSPLSQRSFVLAWVVAHTDYIDTYAVRVKHYLRHLIVSTEDSVGANHLIDNFLSIILLAHMLGLTTIVDWAMTCLRKSCKHWVAAGYFCEKTPCYQALLLGRVRLVRQALSKTGNKTDISFLEKMSNVLKCFPRVHVNDSYLPLKRWETFSAGQAAYARSLPLGNQMTLTIVSDARSDRGCRGHVHDASGALFVHHHNGTQIIGGKGTATYKTSDERNFCRGAAAYCIPIPQDNHTPRLIPWKSFRHTRCRSVDVCDKSIPGLIDLVFRDLLGSGAHWRWQAKRQQVILTSERPSSLGFWSDLCPEEFARRVSIQGGSAPLKSRSSTRYDGIGNAVPCYYYQILFKRDLSLDLVL